MVKTLKATSFDTIAIAAIFAVNAILFLTPSIVSFYFAGYIDSNLGHFHDYSALVATGELPYRDFAIEYPPLTVLFLCLLAPFSTTFIKFRAAFILVMVFMSSACWLGVRSVADKQPRSVLLAAYLLTIISVGPIALVSFDYLPVFFTTLTLLFLCRERPIAAGICLGAATALKGYPAILLAPLVIISWRRTGFRQAVFAFSGWATALAIFLLPAILLDTAGLIKSLTYHSERSLELGSAYSAFLLPLKFAGIKFATEFDHGSWNLTGNNLADTTAHLSTLILAAFVIITWTKIFLETLHEQTPQTKITEPAASTNQTHPQTLDPASTARLFALPIAAFIFSFKVGSPQFLLWLLPFASLIAMRRIGWLTMALLILTGHCQQWIFPWHWRALIYLLPIPIVVLLLEKISFLALFLVILFGKLNNNRSH